MIKITFLGGCREIGRSGVVIESEETGEAVLCDYGVKFDDTEQLFPKHISGKDLTAIVLTHAHIDHCGAIPLFYISGSVPLYTTRLTFEVSKILLEDMLRISSAYIPFEQEEIAKMQRYTRILPYNKRVKVGVNVFITLYDAGHIPGSAMAYIEIDGKRILYTGDINLTKTRLLHGLNVNEIPPVDAVICETTYGDVDHPDREKLEDELNEKVKGVYANSGITLIPAFGVSRSQEIMMVLSKNGAPPFPITLDGMARKVARLYKKYPEFLRDKDEYMDAFNHCFFIGQRDRNAERKNAISAPGVIIAPSGMLRGGTARYYAEHLINDPKNAIDLVSYQVEGTPGRVLMDKGIYIDGDPENGIEVKAEINHFDFSSHAGKSQLIEFLNSLKFIGEKKVFLMHGDEEILLKFEETIKDLGFKTEAPIEGQSFKI